MTPLRSRLRWAAFTALLGLITLMVSCGGGVDSGGTGSYASGPITGYGSIVVGGVHYDESAAAISDEDDGPRTPADLQLGMMTEIEATAPTGSASMPKATAMSVRYRSEIVGPVTAIDARTNLLQVMGQTVVVEATTVFGGGLADLKVGDIVEVYGQLDARAGRYVATRIDTRPASVPAFKLRGLVSSWNRTAKTLVIGGQTIDYSAVPDMPRMVANSTLLRVLLKPDAAARPWSATRIDARARLLPDRDLAEVEGRVTAFTSIAQFEVDGIVVRTDASTRFPNGTAGVVLGAHVEVAGSTRDNILTAGSVSVETAESEGPEPFELSGSIGQLDRSAQTFVVRGFTIQYSPATRFDSSTAADLRDGRRVAVKGALSADGTRLAATTIHVEKGD